MLYDTIQADDCDFVVGKYELFNSTTRHDPFSKQSTFTQAIRCFKPSDYPEILRIPNNLCAKIYKHTFIQQNHLVFPEKCRSGCLFFDKGFYCAINFVHSHYHLLL